MAISWRGCDPVMMMGVQIAHALDAKHAGDVFPQNIKPANIFVTKRDTRRFQIFGLVKMSTRSCFRHTGEAGGAE
jgi:hypothetical protein